MFTELRGDRRAGLAHRHDGGALHGVLGTLEQLGLAVAGHGPLNDRPAVGLVDGDLILQPDLDELVALAGRHVELELLELGLDDAVQGRVARRQSQRFEVRRFAEHPFEQRREHRDVCVAERDRPQRLIGDVFGVDEVVQLVGYDDAHGDRQRLDERPGERRLDDDLGAAAAREARGRGTRQQAELRRV